MKKFLFILPVMAISLAAQATIRRCNNNFGVSPALGVYPTAQAAHDAASAGDTIHIEPSPTNYGAVTCTKRLVWISTGNFLGANPGLQVANTAAGVLSTVYMNNGSAGSVLSIVSNSSCNIYTNDITLHRSFFSANITNSAGVISNLVITNSYALYIDLGNCQNAIVTNNLVAATIGNATSGSAVVTNNVVNITYRPEQYIGVVYLYNSIFQNNIILKGGTYNFENSLASFNITPDAGGLQSGNNNIFNAVMVNVVVNPAWAADIDLKLKAGSPAIGTGSGGADMGAFGGGTPYKPGLQAAIPAITALSSPAAINPSTIQVTFSAKSNN